MKRYYVIQIEEMDMLNSYNGYTDNIIIAKQYIQQIENASKVVRHMLHLSNVEYINVIEIELSNDDELLIKFNMTKEHRLWSIDNDFDGNRVIVNNAIYTKFIETMILQNDIVKYDNKFYTVSSPRARNYVYKYFNNPINKRLALILIRIYEHHRILREQILETDMLLSSNRKDSELWDYMNETIIVKRFIELDISRTFDIFALPFY